ncbi:hypothetical protein JOE31_002734 [Arthrobacter sp. PvP023]|uniref:hypothetical protein n=1 Tax=Micrococcaceae TaxID=1268 RepID=UPI001AEBA4F3|nr:hypothetical protein [Arthrobacter sp. PvP023]MBP1136502.1 hypothetical protein [Arthrobacter sp. PvP023]
MITAIITPTYHVTADQPQLIAERLDAAEKSAQERALREGRHGILVTRYGPTSFAVTLSTDVPYGITLERDLSPRTDPVPGKTMCGQPDPGHSLPRYGVR